MKIIYKIMRNHSRQGVPCVLLEIENEKYFFNVPETTQRFVREHGSKFGKDSKFFFAKLSASHLTGMIGLSLTLFQNGLSQGSKVYGPPGICQFFRDLRYITGIKLCHYSIACLKGEHEEEIVGINEDELLYKLAESPKAVEIFSNWDEWCKLGQIPKASLNSANAFLGFSSILTKELSLKHGLHTYLDKYTEIIFVPISENANAFIIIPKAIRGSFNQAKLQEYGIKGKTMATLVRSGVIEVLKNNTR